MKNSRNAMISSSFIESQGQRWKFGNLSQNAGMCRNDAGRKLSVGTDPLETYEFQRVEWLEPGMPERAGITRMDPS